MSPLCRGAIAGSLLLICTCSVEATSPERSISTSRQFLVYGPNLSLRGSLCELAEKAKHDILQTLNQRDNWRIPIVVWAQYPKTNLPETAPATTSVGQTGSGLKLQLDLKLTSEMTEPEIRRELLRIILLEMMYRAAPNLPPGTICIEPPRWLLEGFAATPRTVAISEDEIRTPDEFLQQQFDSLNALDRSRYSLYSAAFLSSITQLPDGRHRLARFIFQLPSSSGEQGNLQLYFPDLFEDTSRHLWRSQVVRLSAAQSEGCLGWEESERILDELLSLRISDVETGRKYQLHEFPLFIRDSSARPALVRLCRRLRAFAARANPIYHSAICEYEKAAAQLVRGRKNGISERLSRLRAVRRTLATRSRQIDDYLNWFEASKSPGPSALFDDYLKSADLMDRREARRRDTISVYLDALETQFQNQAP